MKIFVTSDNKVWHASCFVRKGWLFVKKQENTVANDDYPLCTYLLQLTPTDQSQSFVTLVNWRGVSKKRCALVADEVICNHFEDSTAVVNFGGLV